MGAAAPAFVPAVLAPLADGIINPATYSGCGAQQRYQAWPARAGLNLEKVEIVLIQQIRTGAGAPAPAPGPTAPAPLAQKIIGLPITPAATPSSAPALAPVQQSAASAGAAGQDNKKTIIIAVVCVVGAAGDHRTVKPCTPKVWLTSRFGLFCSRPPQEALSLSCLQKVQHCLESGCYQHGDTSTALMLAVLVQPSLLSRQHRPSCGTGLGGIGRWQRALSGSMTLRKVI